MEETIGNIFTKGKRLDRFPRSQALLLSDWLGLRVRWGCLIGQVAAFTVVGFASVYFGISVIR